MTAALGALAVGAGLAFDAFEESERAMKQTEAVLQSTGGVANVTATQVRDLAGALSQKAGVDDEVIQAGENMLLTFKNIRNEVGAGNDIFTQATKTTLDLAAGMAAASGGEVDLKSASIQLGKALNDPVAGLTSLTRVGVQFTEEQKAQIAQFVKHNNIMAAQKLILEELNSEFAGSAEAQKTATGTMNVALDSLAETVGKFLAPAVTFLVEKFNELVGFIKNNVGPAFDHIKETVMNAWDAVRPFAETIGAILIPLFTTMWHTIQDRLLPVFERIKPLLILIGGAIVAFATLVLAQFALVVTAVSFLVDKFLDFVGFVRDKVVEPVVNFIGRIIDTIGDVIMWVRDRLKPIWEPLKDAAVTAFHLILEPIQFVIDKVKTLIGWVQTAIEVLGHLFEAGGAAANVSASTGRPGVGNQPPHAATGGFVSRSGMAVIHKGENIIPAGGGGDIVLQIDGQTFARIAREQLLKAKGSRVSLGLS